MKIPDFRKKFNVIFSKGFNIYINLITKLFKQKVDKLTKKQIQYISLAVILGLFLSTYGIYKVTSEGSKAALSIVDNDAEVFFYEGNYDKAIEEYLNIFSKDKDSPIWYMKVAEVYSVKGDIESSKKYIQMAKDLRNKNLDPKKKLNNKSDLIKDAEVANYIMFTEFMNKDYNQALLDGEEDLNKYKDDKKLIKTMLTIYMANGRNDKAKELIDNYTVDKSSSYDMADHARMRMLVDEWQEGLDELKAAWMIDKDEYKVFDVLAQISAYNKDKLLERISQLSSEYPEDPAYKIWLAKIYSIRAETSELAQGLLDEVSGKDVGVIEKTIIQASIFHNSDQIEKADELLNKLILENKNDYRVLHTAGWYYLQKKDIDKALEYCKKSIMKNKNYPDNYGFLMPEILKASNKSSEGEPYFRTALLKEPYNYNIMLTLANYYWYTAKDSEKALEYFKFAEIVRPQDPEIKYNMALIHLSNKRADEAVAFINQCIKLNAAVPKYHRTLGTIYMLKGSYSEGIKEIRSAYEADKEDILTLNNAGCYYITVEAYLEKGEYNLRKAYEGITEETDEYTKNTITENYKKVKTLIEDYNKGNGGELKIPDLVLFY